jgi:hypothetical protein
VPDNSAAIQQALVMGLYLNQNPAEISYCAGFLNNVYSVAAAPSHNCFLLDGGH